MTIIEIMVKIVWLRGMMKDGILRLQSQAL